MSQARFRRLSLRVGPVFMVSSKFLSVEALKHQRVLLEKGDRRHFLTDRGQRSREEEELAVAVPSTHLSSQRPSSFFLSSREQTQPML